MESWKEDRPLSYDPLRRRHISAAPPAQAHGRTSPSTGLPYRPGDGPGTRSHTTVTGKLVRSPTTKDLSSQVLLDREDWGRRQIGDVGCKGEGVSGNIRVPAAALAFREGGRIRRRSASPQSHVPIHRHCRILVDCRFSSAICMHRLHQAEPKQV